jgi:5-methyltetrahydropteroyltriglutamate--homocysteine methyltransferase
MGVAQRISLNPDCRFGTFANRPTNTQEIAIAKIAALAGPARILRAASVTTY